MVSLVVQSGAVLRQSGLGVMHTQHAASLHFTDCCFAVTQLYQVGQIHLVYAC